MSIKTLVFFSTLIQLAKEASNAKRFGTPEEAAIAEAKHESYRQAVMAADGMLIPACRHLS